MAINGAQDSISNFTLPSGEDLILTHIGASRVTEDNGILPPTNYPFPALMASGTYDTTASGSLSIEGTPQSTILIPVSLYTHGQPYDIFAPDQVTGMTIDLPLSQRTFEWSLPDDGNFFVQGNWTISAGSGAPLPDVGDTVQFNKAGTYRVDFGRTAQSDLLEIQAGNASFNGSHTPQTYEVLSGEADVVMTGGILTLGQSNNPNIPDVPVNIEVGDELDVQGDSKLRITNGSVVNVDTLSLVDGTIIVDGNGSELNKDGLPFVNVGQDGIATLTYQNGATGNLGNIVRIATSAADGSSGNFNVLSGANVTMLLLQVATSGTNDTSSGNVLIRGTDAVLNLTSSFTK